MGGGRRLIIGEAGVEVDDERWGSIPWEGLLFYDAREGKEGALMFNGSFIALARDEARRLMGLF